MLCLFFGLQQLHYRRDEREAWKTIQAVAERNIAAEIGRREHTETEDPATWAKEIQEEKDEKEAVSGLKNLQL